MEVDSYTGFTKARVDGFKLGGFLKNTFFQMLPLTKLY